MKKLVRLICAISLLPLLAMIALSGTLNIRFMDQTGRPIPDVVVRYSYTSTPPATGGGTFETKSNAAGWVSITHPCSTFGSCCTLVSPVNYVVIGRAGYSISGSSAVGCSPSSGDLTIFGINHSPIQYSRLSVVSAANFSDRISPEMIVSAFGSNLATTIEVGGLPLPTMLANRRVLFRDISGEEAPVRLLFVSPGQINFITPSQMGNTTLAAVVVRDGNNQIISEGFPIANSIAPGIFTANANGQGVPAAVIVRARADGSQNYESVAEFDQTLQRFFPLALDLGPESDIVVLALFGTGWRNFSNGTAGVSVKVGGIECPVEYTGKQPTIAGVDQLNVRLPRTLIGKDNVAVEVRFNLLGNVPVLANTVQLKIK
ncbi:MAG: hypothetical protein ACKVZH_18735 [Blastocatellia bacterium]